MKSLGTWAAIAVATAFAQDLAFALPHQSKTLGRVQRENATDLTKLTSDSSDKHCTEQINAWRRQLDETAAEYQPLTDSPSTDLSTFFNSNNCAALSGGTYTHADGGVFVISATKSGPTRTQITCEEALEIWKTGFAAFEGSYPAAYKENEGAYEDPNAVALVSLLSSEAQHIFCGTAQGCSDENTVVCYFKPAVISTDANPVTPELWHKVEEHFSLKPKLEPHSTQHEQCLNAVNAVRGAEGLELEHFTGPAEANRRLKRSARNEVEAYERALYDLTCDELDESNVDPAAAEGYTIIYHVKEDSAPGPVEAVDFWKTGYNQLGTSLPPVFKAKKDAAKLRKREEEEEYSEIYYDSAVAGYVSIMADGAREMRCFDASGCNKHALVCVLKGATLQEDQHPISEETWTKILKANGITKPTLTRRSADESCLEEINAVRTHDELELKAFVEESAEQRTMTRSSLLENVTCEAIESGTVVVADEKKESSLMYHYGEEGTCAEAVDAWKQGYEHFSEVDVPPAFNATTDIYKLEGATNFVSLMSNKTTETSIACYTATGCSKNAIVCELKPAALKEGEQPITKSTWENVTEYMASNSAASISSTMALLSSAILAAAAVALQL